MSDFIIKVENLGKKYSIQHQGERERYVALRDVIASKAAAPLRWIAEQRAKRKEQSMQSKEQRAERQAQSASLNGNGASPLPLSTSHSGPDSLPLPLTASPPAPNPSPLPLSTSHSGPDPSPLRLSALPKEEEFWALREVSFEVNRGEVVGIIGRNGAGKSTLLKILSRITEPTEGRVRIRGRVASLLEVGTGFHPELTGRENIFVNGAILGMTRQEVKNKFDEIVAFAEVENFLDTPVKRYSSGMYVRLAFAVAAHLEPEILVVDEVLAVGDAEFQKKCLGKMRDVSKGGRTVLFVSHNMAAIESLCTRCLLLNQGKKDSEGSPEVVIRRYMGLSNASCSGSVEFGTQTGERFGPKELAVLQRLRMSDRDGNPVRTVRMGEPLLVQLEIEFKEAGAGFEIGVAVANPYGVYLHYFVSNWEGFHQVDSRGLKTVEVEVPALYLFPGSYFLSVWVKRQGGAYDDAVHEALGFDVEEASLTPYTTYFARYSHNSQVYAPSRWRFIN